jgi:mono/diheme cytochrome c family protein
MKKTKILLLPLLVTLLVALSGCLSLAEDVTPPPGMMVPSPSGMEQPVPTPSVQEIEYPEIPPDPNNGAVIYAEKCLPCHGEGGLGDGPDAAILENSVSALGSIAVAQNASPVEWFTMVSRGNMQAFMPPFSSLSIQERWDVVAYLFSLSAPAEVIQQGQTLFLENCAECHGEDGSQGVVNFTDQAFMSKLAAVEMITTISTGHELMPSFEALSSDQLWALTSYVRQLSFIPYEPPMEADIAIAEETGEANSAISAETEANAGLPAEETEAKPGFANVEVTVLNPSEESLPANLEVVLRGYDEMTEIYTQTLTIQAGNTVHFADVPVIQGRMYFATIEHQNAAYGSDVVTVEGEISSLSLEIPYYPPTTNQSIVNVDRVHIFIDFISEQALEIFQLYIFSNPSNQVLVPEETNGTVVNFTLPANASNLYVEDNMRLAYQKTDNGFGISNIYPDVEPYQAIFSYQVPYDGSKMDLSIPIGMDANALIVLAPAEGFKVKSAQLEEAGTRQFEGVTYNMYTSAGMQTGSSLLLNLSGHPKENPTIIAASENSNRDLVIGLGGLGLALIVAGLFLWRRNWTEEAVGEEVEPEEETGADSAEDLMDAIIALDDQFRAGSLPEQAYHQRRAELKERLRTAVDSQ